MLSRALIHALERTTTVLRLLRDARRRHTLGYVALGLRFVDVYGRRKYSLREIAKLDLLDPARTRAWLDATASKQAQYEVQRRLNPAAYWVLTEDKNVFYRYCESTGLPVPRYFGCIGIPRRAGPRAAPTIRAHALDVLARADAEELVVKPAQGVHGRDVVGLRREGAHFVDEQGIGRSADAVLDWLADLSEYEAFVVQQRLRGHPRMQALSGTRNLQTVRMVTYVRNDGTPMIGACQLKIIADDSLVDNFAHGQRSNLLGDVPQAGGVVSRAFQANADGSSQFLERHPRTGAAFTGFGIPLWDAACALVQRAACAFRPLRTIGWDVGITADGPVLIEGNASWDPPQRGGDVNGEVLGAMRDDGEWPR